MFYSLSYLRDTNIGHAQISSFFGHIRIVYKSVKHAKESNKFQMFQIFSFSGQSWNIFNFVSFLGMFYALIIYPYVTKIWTDLKITWVHVWMLLQAIKRTFWPKFCAFERHHAYNFCQQYSKNVLHGKLTERDQYSWPPTLGNWLLDLWILQDTARRQTLLILSFS